MPGFAAGFFTQTCTLFTQTVITEIIIKFVFLCFPCLHKEQRQNSVCSKAFTENPSQLFLYKQESKYNQLISHKHFKLATRMLAISGN